MANINSTRYTILFATTVCVVCAALVATAAVSLKPAQVANARLYMEKNVLVAAGLARDHDVLDAPWRVVVDPDQGLVHFTFALHAGQHQHRWRTSKTTKTDPTSRMS